VNRSGPEPAAAAAAALREAGVERADLLVTFGSGQRSPWREETDLTLPYEAIPGWAPPGVEGHPGELSLVRIGEENVLVMVGRHHYYEARSYEAIAAPLRAARALGAGRLLLTNSAGAVREDLRRGDFVLITDHIVLHGPDIYDLLRTEQAGRPDPSYWATGADALRQSADRNALPLAEGVLLCVTGPAYETRAEVEMARRLGAAVVAMSLAPEALIAWGLGFEVSGLSLVTNIAGAGGGTGLHHGSVIEEAAVMQPDLDRLLRDAVPRMLTATT
jgi:purine-nucleoside phosphorylase